LPFGTIDALLRDGEIVLWHRYDQGTFHDFSGNGNEPTTLSNVRLEGFGLRFSGTSGYIMVPDSPELQLTEGTLVIVGSLSTVSVNDPTEVLVSKRDAGGTNYELSTYDSVPFTGWRFYQGSAAPKGGPALAAAMHSVGLTFKDGEFPLFYRSGVLFGAMDLSVSVAVNDAPLYIGNRYTATVASSDLFQGLLIVNRELDGTEMANVHSELEALRIG
jgi:hypothetical protein